jgi:hypothetical protein
VQSKRTNPGAPRSAARRSKVAAKASASMDRATIMAGHSRVYSSITFSIFNVRPSTVVSNW